MADEPEVEQEEFIPADFTLGDGECWISTPDALDPDMECGAGVIAVQYRDGGLYYMTAEARKWVNAETPAKKSAVRSISKT
jgi:hypothetical protein